MILLLLLGWGAAVRAGPPEKPPECAEIRSLLDQSRFAEAETAARELLERYTSRPISLEAAWAIDLLSEALWAGGRSNTADARQLAERAVRIKETFPGVERTDLARSLRNLAIILEDRGDRSALPLYQRVHDIWTEEDGPESKSSASTLVDLANFYLRFDEPARAAAAYGRAASIQAQLGLQAEQALTLTNLANAEHRLGRFDRSREHYEAALAIREGLPNAALDVAWTQNALATLLQDLGYYDEAEALYRQVLETRLRLLGPDHLHVAWARHNLAMVLRKTGSYAEARPLAEAAVRFYDERARDPRGRAVMLGGLAVLLHAMGDHEAALAHYQEALRLRREVLGETHPAVGTTWHDLADVYRALGRQAQARNCLDNTLRIWKESPGVEHPDYALALNDLGRHEMERGDYGAALPYLEQALAIRKRTLGDAHPLVGRNLADLGEWYLLTGSDAAALERYEAALANLEPALGRAHPEVGSTLAMAGLVLARLGRMEDALGSALEAEAIGREHLRLTSRALADREALRYAKERVSGLDLALALAEQGRNPEETGRVWEALVRSRALVLDEMAGRHRAVGAADDPEVQRAARELAVASRRLANLTVHGPHIEHPEAYPHMLEQAREAKERAERDLAAVSASFRRETARSHAGFRDLAVHLPSGSALVAYVRYQVPALLRLPDEGGRPLQGERYLALVLPGSSSAPSVVPLGEARSIDARVRRWQAEAERRRGDESTYREAAAASRQLVWDPIAPLVGDSDRVFVVPDGDLYLVSLATLPAGEGTYLVEAGPLFHYLSAERDLVPVDEEAPSGRGLVALGGPDFDATSLFRALGPVERRPAPAQAPTGAVFRGGTSGCGDFRDLHFEALAEAVPEVEDVARLWGATERGTRKAGSRAGDAKVIRVLSGSDASEAAFKRLAAGSRVVHLATHGFFLGDRCSGAPGRPGSAFRLVPAGEDAARPAPEREENALLLSGVALAGANHRTAAAPDEEDGILTAEEIAALDLGGVEWAVLSACRTAVGTIESGEGVLGMRRAFQVAGARTMIMSLWSVDELATRDWMTALYEKRLQEGLDTAGAVHEASLRMLRDRRKAGESGHPFFWGAFVASGDWR